MKKFLFAALTLASISSYAMEIHNSDGSTTYVTKDANATRLQNSNGSTSYITNDVGGNKVVQNSDGSSSYIVDNNY